MRRESALDQACSSPSGTRRGESGWFAYLLESQNSDGGWGYRLGLQSRVEATSWALLALESEPKSTEAVERGIKWLHEMQLPDGSWPAAVGQREGSWVTSLACLALLPARNVQEAVERGVEWLLNSWPGEGGWAWSLRDRLRRTPRVVAQNLTLRGWSWTPGTSSWVEPTSYALILLHNLPAGVRSRRLARRRQLAEAMLYDRICPGGGWNSGNPVIYGVPGEPQVGPTVWALVALREHGERQENQLSLAWLERSFEEIQSPASLALAGLCLRVYGRPTAALEPALRQGWQGNGWLATVPVVAWMALALRGVPRWLEITAKGRSRP